MAEARHPRLASALKRVGVAIATGSGIFAAFAQAYPSLRDWGQRQFDWWAASPLATTLVLAILAIYILLLVYAMWPSVQAATMAATPEQSPILVDEQIGADFDHLCDQSGANVDDVYSVAVYLWVSNGLPDGTVLKNVQARLYSASGEWVILPICDSDSGTVDIRHGEFARVEVGRMLWRKPSDSNALPAASRAGLDRRVVSQEELRGNLAPEAHWRSIRISSAAGASNYSIGQLSPETPFNFIRIVLSADGVVSRFISMKTNLFADSAHDWLEILPTRSDKSDA